MKADPLKSEGARMERAALLRWLKRLVAKGTILLSIGEVRTWVLDRRERYDKRPGGLGK